MNVLEWCHRIRNGQWNEWWFHKDRSHMDHSSELDELYYSEIATQLLTKGYVTVPFLNENERKKTLKEFQQAELSFREYKRDTKDPYKNSQGSWLGTKQNPYVLGGFGAYGNPSSFHNEYVRTLREKQCPVVIPILRHVLRIARKKGLIEKGDHYKCCMLMDRMCKRPKDTSTTKESYHRDLLPTGRSTDCTIGGWIQLSDDTSYLSCNPGTHLFPVIQQPKTLKGFATEKGGVCVDRVPVPPGHLLLFFQNLGHCVDAVKRKQDSYRQFLVWLLTTHDTSILDYTDVIQQQGVPRLPSHQKTAMYGGNHGSFWLETLTKPWSRRNFIDAVMNHEKGTVDRYMKSLQEYGLPMYPDYKDYEKKMLIPFRKIELSHHVTCSL